MTKAELDRDFVFWTPQVLFAEENGYRLLIEFDAFNAHTSWVVAWIGKTDGVSYMNEFESYAEARDCFLEKVNGGRRMNENPCLNCDCYNEDFGCTMPSIDLCSACPKTVMKEATYGDRRND